MRFLQNIIRKSPNPAPPEPVRRNHKDIAARLRNSRKLANAVETPKFSRAPARVIREPVEPADDASLTDLLDQWHHDGQVENPEEYEALSTEKPVSQTTVERVKTRLLGFDDDVTPDPFGAENLAPENAGTRYPVGWLVITDGPGRGESFTLLTGLSQIGRGTDQAVQLDFGDEAISRINHATIVYDTETHRFLLGHGGKANVVRLNDKPLISTETLQSGDVIRIGETSLQLVVFSTPDRNWTDTSVQEVADVATS